MRKLIFIYLLLTSSTVSAFELFGVTLNNINRVQLREAINNSGAEIIREAGDENWFDIYGMKANFKQSQKMFVGYNKANASFAFLEYHLPYHYLPTMLKRMQAKYGNSTRRYGTFQSDIKHQWLIDGIKIELSYDWHRNVSRLVYTQDDNLQALQQAYQQNLEQKRLEKLDINVSYF